MDAYHQDNTFCNIPKLLEKNCWITPFTLLVSFQILTLFFLLPKRAFQDYRNKQKDIFDIKSRVKCISLKMSEVKSENKYIQINVAHYCVRFHFIKTHFCSLTDTTSGKIFIIAGAPLQVGLFY